MSARRQTLGLLLVGAMLAASSWTPAPTATVSAQSTLGSRIPPAAYKDLRWRSVGASRGGRVTGFAGVRQRLHTFYAGSTGGGVWKTEDAGLTWSPVGDGQITTGSIGSIDVAPSNADHVWVGTGSAAIRSNVIIGRGVFKSTDAGKTFQFMGLDDSGQIGGIRVHPANADVVQTVEDSPHKKGTAFIAVYRYLREHDLRPYVYKTDDYGETWTLLTDGRNGVPMDHPTRVVREDPSREGLLYAGTEFGFFMSADGGKHWQSLQQNLPATPVTDIRVHRNDLVISTMGRGLWIMDNVTALQQLAAIGPSTALAPVHLFQPRDAVRYRYAPTPPSAMEPEYPVAGQADRWRHPGSTACA